jgi:hypothetical protein
VLSRWLTISCLALATASNPVAPPEHVHQSLEHGAVHQLVHRHVQSHFGSSHHAAEHGEVVIDQNDHRIVSFDAAVAMPSATRVFSPVATATVQLLDPPALPVVHGPPEGIDRLIHGPPPTPAGLRAPPALPRL